MTLLMFKSGKRLFKLVDTFHLKKLYGKRYFYHESMPNTQVKLYKLEKILKLKKL